MAAIRASDAVQAGLGLGVGLVLANYMFQASKPPWRVARELIICLKCGSKNHLENKFCWQCGQNMYPMPTIHCTKCGASVPLMKYCGNCGTRLRKTRQKEKKGVRS